MTPDKKATAEVFQNRLARLAIGPSTMRGRGNAGAAQCARRFLAALDLRPFCTSQESIFRSALDTSTDALRRCLPTGARKWGLARKVLNIFLRDCLYSRQLCEHLQLRSAERFFELPLDSVVGKRLRSEDRSVPRWTTIKGLTPKVSDRYQAAGLRIARAKQMLRVDLDALWWADPDRDI